MSSDRPRRRWIVGSAAIAVLIFAIGWLLVMSLTWHERQPSPRPLIYFPPIYAWYAVAPLLAWQR